MAVRKLEHVGIMARNIEDSRHFYESVLGMNVVHEIRHEERNLHLVFLGFAGSTETVIELVGREEHGENETGIVHHLAFTVDDIDFEVQRLQGLNVQFMDDTIQELPDGARYIFFYGPNNEHLELFQAARGR